MLLIYTKNFIISLFFLMLFFSLRSSVYADSFDDLVKERERNFDILMEEAEKEGKEKDKLIKDIWEGKVIEFEKLWEERKREIEKKWDIALRSTNKKWIDYSQDDETRSVVNFEEGIIEITSVVPANNPDIINDGIKKISKHFRKIFSENNPSQKNPIKDQITTSQGDIVASDNLDRFIKDQLSKEVIRDKKDIIPKDGVKRAIVKVRINLLPNHLKIRAKKFMPEVIKYSRKIGVPPEFILAVIHTESYFNPLAQSPAYAFGLMQLIPQYGARDAYKYLFNKDRIVEPSYLFIPDNNIRLGAAYLDFLLKRIFRKINDPIKKRYIAICSYNWGPTKVNKKIVSKNDITRMSRVALFKLLSRKTPRETRDYLDKVTRRIKIYKPMFNKM